jgi:CRISPR-associated protein Csd2
MSHTDASKRHDFVYFFEVADGNPNGDPDAGNLPRTDPETMQGLVSDVCVKRKVRNWIDASEDANAPEHKIYVREGDVLKNKQQDAYTALDIEDDDAERKDVENARAWMCEQFYDIRTFGAVMSHSEFNCGQVLGPLQLTFARSVDPISPMEVSIVRSVPLSEEQKEDKGDMMFGRKSIVPYGLYCGHGFYNPTAAEDTGATDEDLDLFWQALVNCWELDRSASRGRMALRGLCVFSHDNKLGNAPAHQLFDQVTAEKSGDVDAPRSFGDYDVDVPSGDALPDGVTLTCVIDPR